MTKYLTIFLTLLLFGPTLAQEEIEPAAERALIVVSEMGRHLAELESFSVRSESIFDEPLSGQLVEYSQTTHVMAHRARGFRMNTEGDLMNSSAYFDGTNFVMYDHERQFYAVAPFSGTLHSLTDHLAEKLGVVLPLAELLRKDPGEAFLEKVETIFYVGLNSVEGDKCHHVAGRNINGMEWELWNQHDFNYRGSCERHKEGCRNYCLAWSSAYAVEKRGERDHCWVHAGAAVRQRNCRRALWDSTTYWEAAAHVPSARK